MLKTVELRRKFVKLLTERVDITHRHDLLDDTSTEVLLEMKRQIEDRRAKREKNGGVVVEAQANVVGCPPGPPFDRGPVVRSRWYLEDRVLKRMTQNPKTEPERS